MLSGEVNSVAIGVFMARYQKMAGKSNMDPGSYFSSMGESVHQITSEAEEQSIIYVRTEGTFEVMAAEPKKWPRPRQRDRALSKNWLPGLDTTRTPQTLLTKEQAAKVQELGLPVL